MILFVRTFVDRVKQRRRFELAIVLVLGLAGLVMGGIGPNQHRPRADGPNHAGPQETRRAVRVVLASASVAARRALPAAAPLPRLQRRHGQVPATPAATDTLLGRLDRLPARVRGPPAPIVST